MFCYFIMLCFFTGQPNTIYAQHCYNSKLLLFTAVASFLFFSFVGCFTCVPDSFELVYWGTGTDLSVGVWLLSGETLLQVKNFTGRRWDSNLGTCR